MSQLAQQIQYFDDPAPHIIIDNFLSSKLSKEMLHIVEVNKTRFVDADIGGSNVTFFDNCPACTKIREFNRFVKRQNDILYMSHFKDLKDSLLVTGITNALRDQSFQDYISKTKSMFPIINNTDGIEAMCSRHGMCDFYGWHTDNAGDKVLLKRRVITLVYYFNTEPQKFTGGELIIAHPTIATQKIIEPKHNRAVIFLSQTLHCVNTVKLESDEFKDGRFAINYWIGFE